MSEISESEQNREELEFDAIIQLMRELVYCPYAEDKWLKRGSGGVWRPLDQTRLKAILEEIAPTIPDKIRTSYIETLKRECWLPKAFAKSPFKLPCQPVTQEHEPAELPKVIRDVDGDFNVLTGQHGPHDPLFVTTFAVPVKYDPHAQAPTFKRLIRRMLPDERQRNLLLEFAGNLLVAEPNRFKKFFILVGDRDTGKSKVVGAIQALMKGAYGASSIQQLGSRFGAIDLVGKLANFTPETKWPTRNEESLMKQIVGGDVIGAEVKGGPTMSIQPLARLFFTSNHSPRFNDEYLWEKALIVECGPSIPRAQQDLDLDSKLLAELPGIYRILADAAVRLYKRGDFDVPDSSIALRDEAERDSDPVGRFLIEYYESCPDGEVIIEDLVYSYWHWCTANNEKRVANASRLKSRAVNLFGVSDGRHRVTLDGRRLACLRGIRAKIGVRQRRNWSIGQEYAADLAAKQAKESVLKARREAEKAEELNRETRQFVRRHNKKAKPPAEPIEETPTREMTPEEEKELEDLMRQLS